jgi:hypothetical protein
MYTTLKKCLCGKFWLLVGALFVPTRWPEVHLLLWPEIKFVHGIQFVCKLQVVECNINLPTRLSQLCTSYVDSFAYAFPYASNVPDSSETNSKSSTQRKSRVGLKSQLFRLFVFRADLRVGRKPALASAPLLFG